MPVKQVVWGVAACARLWLPWFGKALRGREHLQCPCTILSSVPEELAGSRAATGDHLFHPALCFDRHQQMGMDLCKASLKIQIQGTLLSVNAQQANRVAYMLC